MSEDSFDFDAVSNSFIEEEVSFDDEFFLNLAQSEDSIWADQKEDYEKLTSKEAYLKRYLENTSLRKYLAKWAVIITSFWLISVVLILVFNEKWRICISDSVLLMLLGTTTVNVLGIIFIAMRDLFGGKSESNMPFGE